tara:strand:- start:7314 stop:8018 length:705 start_codon:yes stop_codon:yes gene_type:complete
MSSYVGNEQNSVLAGLDGRFFYALRRTEQGELFYVKVDQLDPNASIQINKPGDAAENFNDFTQGQDFFEGRSPNHEILYDNLNFEQLRWDDRNIYYYVNDQGELVAKINRPHTYATGVSTDGDNNYNPHHFKVTVAGGKILMNDIITPTLNLYEGQTYTFAQEDPSVAAKAMRLSTTPDGVNAGGIEYTTGITILGTDGIIGSYIKFVVPVNCPTLYYYCITQSGHGGQINTLA